MSRRNLYLLSSLLFVCLICAAKVSRYGRVMVYAMDQIGRRSLQEVSDQKLFEGALDGMMSQLDPYSAYIKPSQLEGFREQIDQEFGGVGIQIVLDPKTEQILVASPLVDSPAYRAGIRAGDKILRIAGQSTQGLSLDDARARMRGKPREPVVLTVLHHGEEKPRDIEVVREVIRVPSVIGDTRNDDGSWNYFLQGSDHIAYVEINTFGKDTSAELSKLLAHLAKQGMRGLILDLRNNPGGLLDAAIATCDLFIPSGVIVTTRSRDGLIRRTFSASGAAPYPGLPIAVLVNKATASASEIVAACLQDHQRAVIVGERTYGKGTVQEIIRLQEDQGELKLTTASYWRPSGRNIHRDKKSTEAEAWGVSPDEGYQVPVQGDELAKLARWRYRRTLSKLAAAELPDTDQTLKGYTDAQLARARQYIEHELGDPQLPTTSVPR